MKLKSWIELERGRAMSLAKFIDVPPSFVSKIVAGEKAIPAEHCKAIERHTGGEVTCQEMRPNDWHKYWPELAEATAQPTQAATQTVAIQPDALREGTVRRQGTRRAGELAIPLEDRRSNDVFAQGL